MKKQLLHYNKIFTLFLLIALIFCKCGGGEKEKRDEELQQFIKEFEAKFIPLDQQIRLAEFNAAVTGNDEDYKKAAELNIQLTKLFANKEDFKTLKDIKENGVIEDELLKRQFDILYGQYTFHQVDEKKMEEMIRDAKNIQQKFSIYRAEIDGKKYSDNQIDSILIHSRDHQELEKAWKASKQVGEIVADEMIKLVKLRNEAAKSLGYDNYHAMRLSIDGQDPEEITSLFEELDILTKHEYSELKYRMDDTLASLYSISVEELRPWHYQDRFVQAAPRIFDINFDSYFVDKDIIEIVKKYYDGIGLDVESIVSNSDLYEKPGKSQHAFTYDIDRTGDVRVLANVKPNHYWMKTMMYEFGFGSYLENISRDLPYLLRQPAHYFMNDGIGEMFNTFSSDSRWLKTYAGMPEEEAEQRREECRRYIRLFKFIFSRFSQVMYHFEKGMYENPDQDLNKLWWDLVEKYQLIKRPDNRDKPDWATKIHLFEQPCTYHNYMLGELFSSQVYAYIQENIVKHDEQFSFIENPEIGDYLKTNLFAPGAKYSWKELVEKSTGEELSAEFFKMQFVSVK